MNRLAVSSLRCPACRHNLQLEPVLTDQIHVEHGSLSCDCGQTYSIADGIPNLIYPEQLLPSDEHSQNEYEQSAEKYDAGLEWLFRSFYQNENDVRSALIDLLELHPNTRVLEVGCGTGKDSVQIAAQLGEKGELYVQDISPAMIRLSRMRLAGLPPGIEYFLGNAAYLPFDDGYFDAAFHFGGLNTFGEIGRALEELARVVKVGGRVVIGDEGIAPWLREAEFGRILINANPLYKNAPPLEHLPANAQEVNLQWIMGNAFYVIAFRVGDGPPRVDLDLPIPGKGDSLRSRYQDRKNK